MDHISVLKNEVLENFEYLSDISKGYFVDGTLGAAGHSIEIAKKTKPDFKIIGIDQDKTALEIARNNINAVPTTNGGIGVPTDSVGTGMKDKFILIHNNFSNIKDVLIDLKINQIDGMLLDLGVSSMQFDNLERGFSFKDPDQILDMRMDQTQTKDAKDILNNYSKTDIEKILFEYGEERFARQIAFNITRARKDKPIIRVSDLVEIVRDSIPSKMQHGKIHFATKTFQALRIAVNNELSIIDQTILDVTDFLKSGSRLAIISFHSLEDRIVKNTFRHLEHPCECPPALPCVCGKLPIVKILTRKPIISGNEELKLNPRARSAKLRIVEKI